MRLKDQVAIVTGAADGIGWATARCLAQRAHRVALLDLRGELVRARELDYLFSYRAPLLFADDKAKGIFHGLRPERPAQGVRLADVRHEVQFRSLIWKALDEEQIDVVVATGGDDRWIDRAARREGLIL